MRNGRRAKRARTPQFWRARDQFPRGPAPVLPHMKTTRLLTGGAVVAASLVLVACGGGDPASTATKPDRATTLLNYRTG